MYKNKGTYWERASNTQADYLCCEKDGRRGHFDHAIPSSWCGKFQMDKCRQCTFRELLESLASRHLGSTIDWQVEMLWPLWRHWLQRYFWRSDIFLPLNLCIEEGFDIPSRRHLSHRLHYPQRRLRVLHVCHSSDQGQWYSRRWLQKAFQWQELSYGYSLLHY